MVAMLALLAVACAPLPEAERDRAATIARDYLVELTSPSDPERGWGMLHPVTQQDMFTGSRDEYLRLVAQMAVADTRWEIDVVEEEDPGLWEVVLSQGSRLPDELTAPQANHLWLVGWRDGSRSQHSIFVRLDQFGGSGVWAMGG
jgi:hypothetical protein